MHTTFRPTAPLAPRPITASAVTHVVRLSFGAIVWAYVMCWPVLAIALLAFVFADPAMSPAHALQSLFLVAVGSLIAAVIDGRLMSNEPWSTFRR